MTSGWDFESTERYCLDYWLLGLKVISFQQLIAPCVPALTVYKLQFNKLNFTFYHANCDWNEINMFKLNVFTNRDN